MDPAEPQPLQLRDADCAGSSFVDVRLTRSRFNHVELAGCLFQDVNLTGARILNGDLSGLEIQDCELAGVRIEGVLLTELLTVYRKNV